MPTLKWTPLAEQDLEAIEVFIAQEDPITAIRVVLTIVRNVKSLLTQYPRLGRMGRVPGTRELVITGTPFIVAYEEVGAAIHILAVIHSARQWPDQLQSS